MHDRISVAEQTVPLGRPTPSCGARQATAQSAIPVFCRKSREFLRRGRKENRADPLRDAQKRLHVEIGPLRSHSRATVQL